MYKRSEYSTKPWKYYITVIIKDCESNEVLLKHHNIKIFQVTGSYPVGVHFLCKLIGSMFDNSMVLLFL